jgi:hypothetical protein
MIHKQILVVSIKTRSKTLQDSRPTYGKIKFAPPHGRQAIGMAGLLAGASVGARAARRQKKNKFSTVSGTGPRIGSRGSAR